jgi:CIC family chloride channel protein
LIWFLVIGIVSAAIGYLYARTFHATVALTNWLPGGSVLKPAVGGLLVGLLALVIPQILSSGYGWAQKAAATDTLMTIPLWIVLVLPIAKIVATSLSIGTGGSGGIFGPGIVIGAFVGAAIWRLADLAGAPGISDGPGVFVVAGMMACFGSVAHAPLAVMIMVAEMAGSFSVVPGAIIAVGIAYLLISRTDVSIYRAQRRNREAAEAERRRAANTEGRPTPRSTFCSESARSHLQNVDFGGGGNLLTGGYQPAATKSWTTDRRPWRRAVVVAIGLAAAVYLLVRCAQGHLLS